MNKIEIFLPLPGQTAALNDYFTSPNVIRIGGLPTGPELYSDDLTREELLEIGFEAAQDKLNSLYGFDKYTAHKEYPLINEMYDKTFETHIGWEFEFDVTNY